MYYKRLRTWFVRGLKKDRVRVGGVLRRGLEGGLKMAWDIVTGYCQQSVHE